MANGIDGIDHAVVAVADLDGARRRFERLGFSPSPRRRMVGWGTANFSVMFERDFIELLGIIDPSAFLTPGLADFLEGGEGIMAVTLRANDVTAAYAALTRAGAAPTPLGEVTINCEAPDGVLEQRFRWLKIGEAATPDMYLMLVQPLTPQNMRRPAWTTHRNGVRAIRAMTVAVEDPARLAAPYEALFGANARAIPGGLAIFTGHGDFRYVTRDALAAEYGALANGIAHAAPAIAVLTLETENLTAARTCLDEARVPFEEDDDTLRLAPGHACGMILEFVAA